MTENRRMATPSTVRLPVGFQARSHAAPRQPMARPQAEEGYDPLFTISGCAVVIAGAAVVLFAIWAAMAVLALAAGPA